MRGEREPPKMKPRVKAIVGIFAFLAICAMIFGTRLTRHSPEPLPGASEVPTEAAAVGRKQGETMGPTQKLDLLLERISGVTPKEPPRYPPKEKHQRGWEHRTAGSHPLPSRCALRCAV